MKKVLAAGAALIVAGALATTASAEVNLSGDARVRYIITDNYGFTDTDTADTWNSRVRVKVDAKAPGGAYAKARLRFNDTTWNHTGSKAYKNGDRDVKDSSVWSDYGYLGIPMGDNFVIEGGIMLAGYSKFLADDERRDRLKLTWKNDSTKIIGLYDMIVNDTSSTDDFRGYGLVGITKINDALSLQGYIRYHDDARELAAGVNDKSGWLFDARGFGKVGDLGWAAEYVFKQSDYLGQEDDGWGVYGEVTYGLGALSLNGNVGFSQEGFVADESFGWIMVGGDEPIMAMQVGEGGDSWWVGGNVKYAVSESLELVGNVVYIDVDEDNADELGGHAYEISGSVKYIISDGADFSWKVGYLISDLKDSDDNITDDANPFGTYGRLAIRF